MVTRVERAVYAAVLERDRLMVFEMNDAENPVWDISLKAWLATDPRVCVAPVIDLSALGTCSGEMTRDHVHTHTGGTKGKRPLTTLDTVVILCWNHHLNGWATSHRPEIRAYIKGANERYRASLDLPRY